MTLRNTPVRLASLGLALGTLSIGLSASSRAELIYGVTFDNQLITFDSAAPQSISSGLFLDGLQGGENVAGIDFRAATGELYVLGTSSRLYTANLTTGSLTQVGPRFNPILSGTSFGFGYNPVADAFRVTSDTEQNLRVNPTTAAVTVDGSLTINGVSVPQSEINGVAYTNDGPGATSTTLYALGSQGNNLLRSTNPNSGDFSIVGSLGSDITGLNGFDISGNTGIAYASVQLAGTAGSRLATINLATGALTVGDDIGSQGSITQLRGLAVAPVPEPASLAVIGVGLAALIRRKKRS